MPGLDGGFYYNQTFPAAPVDRRALSEEPPHSALRRPRPRQRAVRGVEVVPHPLRGHPPETLGTRALLDKAGVPRAAGMASGWPHTFEYQARFEQRTPKIPLPRARSIGPFSSMLDRRFQTMKYDTSWYAYNDIDRPFCPSDFTGWVKHFKG